MINQARTLRNTRLDPQSRFGRVFAGSSRLEDWEHLRGSPQQALEAQDLITKLMISPESAEFPLAAHGLGSSADGALVRAAFPEFASDPATGAPDRGRQMTEAEIYAGTAQALGVPLDGVTLPDMRAMRRSA